MRRHGAVLLRCCGQCFCGTLVALSACVPAPSTLRGTSVPPIAHLSASFHSSSRAGHSHRRGRDRLRVPAPCTPCSSLTLPPIRTDSRPPNAPLRPFYPSAQAILQGLRSPDDEAAQLTALSELNELLSISSEDNLAGFPVESVVPLLVGQGQDRPPPPAACSTRAAGPGSPCQALIRFVCLPTHAVQMPPTAHCFANLVAACRCILSLRHLQPCVHVPHKAQCVAELPRVRLTATHPAAPSPAVYVPCPYLCCTLHMVP